MWNRPSNWTWLAASILVTPTVAGFAAGTNAPAGGDNNRLSLNMRMGFNIQGRFSQIGTFQPAHSPGGTGSALDHYYEDGYVRVDSSGNAGGQTWFWGYNNASQVSGNNILFHSTSSQSASAPHEVTEDPQLGLELVWNHKLGTLGDNNQSSWGLEASFGWMAIGIDDNSTARANVTRLTDSYGYTAGTTPPAAPFRGTFSGPNFTIFDTPSRTSQTLSGVAVHGNRQFDGDLFIGHLGPYADIVLLDNLLLTISGGLALGGMSSQFQWNESINFAGGSTLHHHASGTHGDVLVGGYVGGKLVYNFNPRWSANFGVQYEGLNNYSQVVAGHKASINLGQSIYLSLGLGYTF